MIKRIAIKNYQSLYDVTLEMGKFTVIFGDSDVGKSAVYRAIRGLVTAEDGDSFISEGKPKAGVVIDTPSDSVAWIKARGKSSKYYLFKDGVKVGEWSKARMLPAELAGKLRFEQLIIDNEKFYPNFRGQFDPLFLLFETPGKRARFLGFLVSNLLLKGIKKANVERNRSEADIRAMQNLVEDLETRLGTDWKSWAVKAKSLSGVATHLTNQINVAVVIKALSMERQVIIEDTESLNDLSSRSSKIVEELDIYVSGRRLLEELQPLVERRKILQKSVVIKVIPLEEELVEKLIRMEKLESWLSPKVFRMRVLKRDISLVALELESFNKELKSLDIKLEVAKSVKCPYCNKEFKL